MMSTFTGLHTLALDVSLRKQANQLLPGDVDVASEKAFWPTMATLR